MAAAVSRDQKSELMKYGRCDQKASRLKIPCSPQLSSASFERISKVLDIYNGTISIGGRKITTLRFADDIDGITVEEDEITKLVHNLDAAAAKSMFN